MPRFTSLLRRAAAGFVAGSVIVGAAWAGVVVDPLSRRSDRPGTDGTTPALPSRAATVAVEALSTSSTSGLTPPDLSGLTPLPAGEFLVGASVTSLEPDAAKWQTTGCSQYASNFPDEVTHLADAAVRGETPGWPRSPDCIYLGGYGIGPARAATGVDPHAGVNVRSLAVSNGDETVVWQMVDMVGFFRQYREDLCTACGILDIRRTIGGATGIPVDNLAIGSTHTHGGADGYGAWGGLPRWYREQVRDQIIVSAYDALRALQPATLEVGSVDARPFSSERRDTYQSVADYGAVWLRAATKAAEPQTIATLVNYAAHPVVLDDQPLLHGDWPATASKALGDELGGVGLVFEGGLGNVSPSSPKPTSGDLTGDGAVDQYDEVVQMGGDFADLVAGDVRRGGHRLASNTIAAANTVVEHPVTNWAEAGLGIAGLLDRPFLPGDSAGVAGTYQWSDSGGAGAARSCATAAPNTIRTDVSAYRVGELTVVTGPGELFSASTLVAKSKARKDALAGGQTMVFAQTQDSLGYIIQSYEVDPAGGVVTNVGPVEYEETFMLDRCFGDHVLQAQLATAAALP